METDLKSANKKIKLLEKKVRDLEKSSPGSFWSDPKKSKLTRKKMSLAAKKVWTNRAPILYSYTFRATGETKLTDNLNEISKVTGLKPHTIRCKISRGKGSFECTANDKIITIQKEKKR